MNKNQKNIVYQYSWKGLNPAQELVKGNIQAPNLLVARTLLLQQGVQLKQIKRKLVFFAWDNRKKIRSKEITLFTRQIATLLEAGVSLIHALEIFKDAHSSIYFQLLITELKRDLENGLSFSDTLTKYPLLFNSLYCSLVQVGEKTATLASMLHRIASYRENSENLRKKIKKALSYPLIILSTALFISNILVMIVIPQFKNLFDSFGAPLPLITQCVISLSENLKNNFMLLSFFFLTLIFGGYFLKRSSHPLTEKLDYFILKIPLFGSILTKAIIARFSRTLALTSIAGLPLIEALHTIANATANRIYILATHRIGEDLLTGKNLPEAIQSTGLFPNKMVQMLIIGEESGMPGVMLHKIADAYEEEINQTISYLNLFLEPCIMLLLGLFIGILLIALYLPIFKLGTVI